MRPDTTLNLGQFQFAGLEIPPSLKFGGSQDLAVHKLIGGTRVIDAMGRSDHALEWSGIFMGATAVDRARFLDTLRVQGLPQALTWAQFSYQVIVHEFEADYQRYFQVPYRISCEVIADLANPVTNIAAAAIDQAITDDLNVSTGLGSTIGDSTLSGLIATLNTAISTVSSFAHAAQSTINNVLQPLAAVQARVQLLIAATGNLIGNVTTFGGVLPATPVSQAAASLMGQLANVTQMGALIQLRNVTGRMGSNFAATKTSQNTVATAGGNLFAIAQKQYGDPMAWTGIAKANGLTDPFIQGTAVLNIPAQPDNQGGLLGA